MKGKTTCPCCNKEIVLDIPENSKTHKITCPSCNHKFIVKKTNKENTEKECGWEEHGEPRKAILSSSKKKTKKPIISSFLLLTVGVLGIFTAVIFITSDNPVLPEFDFIISFLSSLNVDKLLISIIFMIFSIFSIIGSLTSYMRKYYNFTVLCAVLGIFSIGLFIGIALSIIALILVIFSRDEFEDKTLGKIF